VCLEGIEDENDLDIAHELKVTFGQGWLLGRPMTVSDFNLKYR